MTESKQKSVKKTTKKKAVKKAPKKAETNKFMDLLKKGWEYDKNVVKSWWEFLKVGDACSFVVGAMALWLLCSIVINIF